MATILEIIFSSAIVILLLIFFGVPLDSIIVIIAAVMLGLVSLMMLLFSLFFIITDITLLFKKRTKGIFLRVDDSDRFDHAVYKVENEEYVCSFPAETFGRRHIYQENHAYFLLIPQNPARRTALDRHSLVIIFIGTFFSLFFIGLLFITARYFLGLL